MKKLIIILYGLFLLSFSIFSYLFIDPNLSYLKNLYSGFIFSNRLLTTIFYTASIIVFFIFYSIFVYLGIKKEISLRNIFILLAITALILFFSYPAMLSFDIFNYVATSKVLYFYHENPYIIMPIEFLGDPLLAFTHAANKIALYAPFWLVLTGIPYALGFGSFIAILFSFKIFIAIFYIGTTILIWKMSKNLISVILFALNPLVIIETLMSGHNDVVMIFFALLSFFLLMKKRVGWAILFFILSVLIKYTTLLLIPVFLLVIWKIIKRKEIRFEKIFYYSSILMFIGFLLSPIREESYPWYAIWFLPFVFLVPGKKILLATSIAFSFSLLLRYIPFMFTGVYTSQVSLTKEIISFVPPILVFLYYGLEKKI